MMVKILVLRKKVAFRWIVIVGPENSGNIGVFLKVLDYAVELYDGAAGPLVLQLVRETRLTPQEISDLHTLIERLDGMSGRGGSSGESER